MSGRKQHYLPQFLQRGFATNPSDKVLRHVTYYKERIIPSNSKDSGAERDFYSDVDLDADDPITKAESEFGSLANKLRSCPPGPITDLEGVARLLAHLEVRTRQVRTNLRDDAENLTDQILKELEDPEVLKRAFRENAPAEMLPFAELLGSPLMQQHVKCLLANFRGPMHTLLTEAAKRGQVKALASEVAPANKVFQLTGINYYVYSSAEILVLGDSPVFFKLHETGEYRPFLDKEVLFEFVALPLSPHRVLVGGRNLSNICPTGLTMAAIHCSHQFFIFPELNDHLKGLSSGIGLQAKLIPDTEKEGILRNLFGGLKQSSENE